jgi:class 3 adenylate cyclase
MSYRELHYCWKYELKASPEKLWPFVADTNRFNRDTGVPSVEPSTGPRQRLRNARQRLRLSIYGMAVEWEEQPFEWVRPFRFGVARTYTSGPMAQLRALAELTPRADGGTTLMYHVWTRPRSLLGAITIPLQLRFVSSGRFARAFRMYDEIAATEAMAPASESQVELSPAMLARTRAAREKLLAEGAETSLVDRLIEFVQSADDLALARVRPYELADEWKASRCAVLETCLRATRAGLLDLQWDLLCPLCRGAEATESLRDISSNLHCETCRIDFTVNFDRFVEVTFRPNASLRRVERRDFCMGSPQRTPHIVAQQLLAAHTNRALSLPLEPGRYRLRALELPGGQDVSVSHDGNTSAQIAISEAGWPHQELKLATQSSLHLENATDAEQLFILERLAWSDQAATAAEVTALQIFRDLFSSEALRPGEQISVGTLTVLFTDLRNSTRMYREIGDATAFGRVMSHFDVLRNAIAAESGALVKTIGDAVMAVFREPENALRAMLKAQQILAAPVDGSPALTLKAGLHSGPCIAVSLNDRLDYFGSTVNMAARLEGLSTGNDVVISRAVHDDPEVRAMVDGPASELSATRFQIELKGFDAESFELWRVARREARSLAESSG